MCLINFFVAFEQEKGLVQDLRHTASAFKTNKAMIDLEQCF